MQSDPCQIYLITPPIISDLTRFCQTLDAALSAAPVACLQIRLKDISDKDIIKSADAIVPIAQSHSTLVLINDRPDLVAACNADGAHIGQDDMDYFSSRKLLGEDAIIGVTCHNSRELAFEAANAGANYVAFGAFFETKTKSPKYRADMEILSWWQNTVEIPSVAIGGISVENAAMIIEAGADFIAISSGVWDYAEGAASAISHLYQLCQSSSGH
jgi:thiamine-phosphate pyrophosphorylase